MDLIKDLVYDLYAGISPMFIKILYLNLDTEQMEIVKINDAEFSDLKGKGITSYHSWIKNFAKTDVYEDDRDKFLKFASLENIKDALTKDESISNISLKYRRKNSNGYTYYAMDCHRAAAWREEYPLVIIFVRELECDWNKLKLMSTYDGMTQLRGKYSYDEDRREAYPPFGIIYADLNHLKEINDTKGHDKGDEEIKRFANMMISCFRRDECYRVGGDEFVVILEEVPRDDFYERAEEFKQLVSPIAAVGYSWSDEIDDINVIIADAEAEMYTNKKLGRA